jgi:hypothetical protein
MHRSIIGLQVQIIIDEDGSSQPPILPPGTIVRTIIGPDREMYYLVHLDNPVRTRHVKTGGDWIIHNLAVAPNFKGGTLGAIITSADNYVTVGIANMFALPDADDPLLNFSKGEYFATGRIKRAV